MDSNNKDLKQQVKKEVEKEFEKLMSKKLSQEKKSLKKSLMKSIKKSLKKSLLKSLKKSLSSDFVYNNMCQSWATIENPPVLFDVVTHQKKNDCWAEALIRMFDAVLKINGYLLPGEELSVEEFVANMSEKGVNKNGYIKQMEHALRYDGAVLVNGGEYPQRYYVDSIDVFYGKDFQTPETFESLMIEHFASNPLACSIFVHDSYERMEPGLLYTPTPQELKDGNLGYKIDENGEKKKIDMNSLLLTGVHHEYFQLQHTRGPLFGKNGFIYVARGVGVIVDFSVIELDHDLFSPRGPACGKLDISSMILGRSQVFST